MIFFFLNKNCGFCNDGLVWKCSFCMIYDNAKMYLLPVLTAPMIHLQKSSHRSPPSSSTSDFMLLKSVFWLFWFSFCFPISLFTCEKWKQWGRDGNISTWTGSHLKRNYSSNMVSEMTGLLKAKQVNSQTQRVDVVDVVPLTGLFCLWCCAVISHQQDFQVVPVCIGVFEGETGFPAERTRFFCGKIR